MLNTKRCLSLFCTSCEKEDLFCNPYSNEDVKFVNAKSVLVARMVGMGRGSARLLWV